MLQRLLRSDNNSAVTVIEYNLYYPTTADAIAATAGVTVATLTTAANVAVGAVPPALFAPWFTPESVQRVSAHSTAYVVGWEVQVAAVSTLWWLLVLIILPASLLLCGCAWYTIYGDVVRAGEAAAPKDAGVPVKEAAPVPAPPAVV